MDQKLDEFLEELSDQGYAISIGTCRSGWKVDIRGPSQGYAGDDHYMPVGDEWKDVYCYGYEKGLLGAIEAASGRSKRSGKAVEHAKAERCEHKVSVLQWKDVPEGRQLECQLCHDWVVKETR